MFNWLKRTFWGVTQSHTPATLSDTQVSNALLDDDPPISLSDFIKKIPTFAWHNPESFGFGHMMDHQLYDAVGEKIYAYQFDQQYFQSYLQHISKTTTSLANMVIALLHIARGDFDAYKQNIYQTIPFIHSDNTIQLTDRNKKGFISIPLNILYAAEEGVYQLIDSEKQRIGYFIYQQKTIKLFLLTHSELLHNWVICPATSFYVVSTQDVDLNASLGLMADLSPPVGTHLFMSAQNLHFHGDPLYFNNIDIISGKEWVLNTSLTADIIQVKAGRVCINHPIKAKELSVLSEEFYNHGEINLDHSLQLLTLYTVLHPNSHLTVTQQVQIVSIEENWWSGRMTTPRLEAQLGNCYWNHLTLDIKASQIVCQNNLTINDAHFTHQQAALKSKQLNIIKATLSADLEAFLEKVPVFFIESDWKLTIRSMLLIEDTTLELATNHLQLLGDFCDRSHLSNTFIKAAAPQLEISGNLFINNLLIKTERTLVNGLIHANGTIACKTNYFHLTHGEINAHTQIIQGQSVQTDSQSKITSNGLSLTGQSLILSGRIKANHLSAIATDIHLIKTYIETSDHMWFTAVGQLTTQSTWLKGHSHIAAMIAQRQDVTDGTTTTDGILSLRLGAGYPHFTEQSASSISAADLIAWAISLAMMFTPAITPYATILQLSIGLLHSGHRFVQQLLMLQKTFYESVPDELQKQHHFLQQLFAFKNAAITLILSGFSGHLLHKVLKKRLPVIDLTHLIKFDPTKKYLYLFQGIIITLNTLISHLLKGNNAQELISLNLLCEAAFTSNKKHLFALNAGGQGFLTNLQVSLCTVNATFVGSLFGTTDKSLLIADIGARFSYLQSFREALIVFNGYFPSRQTVTDAWLLVSANRTFTNNITTVTNWISLNKEIHYQDGSLAVDNAHLGARTVLMNSALQVGKVDVSPSQTSVSSQKDPIGIQFINSSGSIQEIFFNPELPQRHNTGWIICNASELSFNHLTLKKGNTFYTEGSHVHIKDIHYDGGQSRFINSTITYNKQTGKIETRSKTFWGQAIPESERTILTYYATNKAISSSNDKELKKPSSNITYHRLSNGELICSVNKKGSSLPNIIYSVIPQTYQFNDASVSIRTLTSYCPLLTITSNQSISLDNAIINGGEQPLIIYGEQGLKINATRIQCGRESLFGSGSTLYLKNGSVIRGANDSTISLYGKNSIEGSPAKLAYTDTNKKQYLGITVKKTTTTVEFITNNQLSAGTIQLLTPEGGITLTGTTYLGNVLIGLAKDKIILAGSKIRTSKKTSDLLSSTKQFVESAVPSHISCQTVIFDSKHGTVEFWGVDSNSMRLSIKGQQFIVRGITIQQGFQAKKFFFNLNIGPISLSLTNITPTLNPQFIPLLTNTTALASVPASDKPSAALDLAISGFNTISNGHFVNADVTLNIGAQKITNKQTGIYPSHVITQELDINASYGVSLGDATILQAEKTTLKTATLAIEGKPLSSHHSQMAVNVSPGSFAVQLNTNSTQLYQPAEIDLGDAQLDVRSIKNVGSHLIIKKAQGQIGDIKITPRSPFITNHHGIEIGFTHGYITHGALTALTQSAPTEGRVDIYQPTESLTVGVITTSKSSKQKTTGFTVSITSSPKTTAPIQTIRASVQTPGCQRNVTIPFPNNVASVPFYPTQALKTQSDHDGTISDVTASHFMTISSVKESQKNEKITIKTNCYIDINQLGQGDAYAPESETTFDPKDTFHLGATTLTSRKIGLPDDVFRGDARPPDDIFSEGFKARGTNTKLATHLWDSDDSAFISTTYELGIAKNYPQTSKTTNLKTTFVYRIYPSPDGIDMLSALGNNYPNDNLKPFASALLQQEAEYAIPFKIPNTDIKGAYEVHWFMYDENKRPIRLIGPYTANEHYQPPLQVKLWNGGRLIGTGLNLLSYGIDITRLSSLYIQGATTKNYELFYKESLGTAGSWTLSLPSGYAGAKTGAWACAPLYPPFGSLACAAIGGIIGGVTGSWAGDKVGKKIYAASTTHHFFKPHTAVADAVAKAQKYNLSLTMY